MLTISKSKIIQHWLDNYHIIDFTRSIFLLIIIDAVSMDKKKGNVLL